MSKTSKILIGVVVLLLGASALCCCGGVLVVRARLPDLQAQGKEVEADAQRFAASANQDGCVSEGLARLDQCGGLDILCESLTSVWLQACLDAATPVAGFCDEVPSKSEIMKGAQFEVASCQAIGRPQDQRCGRFMGAIMDHCHPI